MAISISADRLVAPPQAASFLGIKRQTLGAWRIRGRGPEFVKVGSRVFYRLSALDKYVEGQTRSSTGDAKAS